MSELGASFLSGCVHPLHGADHLVAMVAVGIWGAIAGGRAIRVWPIAFVATMLLGFVAAVSGMPVPTVEPAIRVSVVVLGLLVALAVNAPLWIGAAVIAFFAFFHGHVHGTEAASASIAAYAMGLAVATGALHGAGIVLCRAADDSIARAVLRAMGAVAAGGAILATLAWT